MKKYTRIDNRAHNVVRPIVISHDVYGYADASVLFEQGNTKVLVAVTMQQGVPHFLKGKKTGWLSAEYAMLPTATGQRTQRESSMPGRNARNVEISRLIGRCLRTTIDFDAIGERNITIDCDVLQADGGTRVASITAASIALNIASQRWLADGKTDRTIFKNNIAALSVGIVNGELLTDLSYHEDSQADADFNFIFSQAQELIEIQGTSEKKPVSLEQFDILKNLAIAGVADVFAQCAQYPLPIAPDVATAAPREQATKAPLFSLGSRLKIEADSK